MTFTQAHLDKINKFEQEATVQDFIAIYGETIGAHLFGKFAKADFNLIRLYAQLTTDNIQKLIGYLNCQP